MAETRLHALEFETLKSLRAVPERDWLVAVSGGRDSVALLETLARLRARLGLRLEVAHVHHGPGADRMTREFRGRAAALARAHAERLGLAFHLVERPPGRGGESEAALREFRHGALAEIRARGKLSWIVLAHHHEDLLETRLLRLVRGTGPEGLRAMKIRGGGRKLRPWLGTRKHRIAAYASERKLEWAEDPSNLDTKYFRNWLRVEWLPKLEAVRPGSTESLARSLALLSESISGANAAGKWSGLGAACLVGDGIDRLAFSSLPERERRFVLALYARRIDVRDMGRGRVQEILKRLDTDQKSLSFRVGGLQWLVNAEQIRAVRF